MSATTRFPGATKKSSESSARSGQAAMAQSGADHSKETARTVSETVAEAVDTATAMSSKVAEETREAMMMGVRAAFGVAGRVADIRFGRGHHLLASAAHTMDFYREASERSAEDVQALVSSWMTMGRRLQQMQHAWLKIFDDSMEHAAHKPLDLLRCKTMVEVAEVQRDLYRDAVDHALGSSRRLLEMMNQTAQAAARPLQNHHD